MSDGRAKRAVVPWLTHISVTLADSVVLNDDDRTAIVADVDVADVTVGVRIVGVVVDGYDDDIDGYVVIPTPAQLIL